MRRCPGCMRPTEEAVCPVCGWTREQGNEPHQLRPGTVLRGQYVIGKALGHSTPATTGRIYTHLSDQYHSVTLGKVADALK